MISNSSVTSEFGASSPDRLGVEHLEAFVLAAAQWAEVTRLVGHRSASLSDVFSREFHVLLAVDSHSVADVIFPVSTSAPLTTPLVKFRRILLSRR